MGEFDIAAAGHNSPPSAFDELSQAVEDHYLEARNWLDGEPVQSPEIAEGVVTLMRDLQAKGKLAEGMRKAEKQPHLDAGKAVDAKFKPLSEQVKRAVDACKEALLPWEKKQHELQQAKAEEARRVAAEKEAEAFAAVRSADKSNIAEAEAAEDGLKVAKAFKETANREARKTGTTKVEGERAVGIRTDYIPHIENRLDALMHYYSTAPDTFDSLLLQLARQDVLSGVRTLPGFTIEKKEQVI